MQMQSPQAIPNMMADQDNPEVLNPLPAILVQLFVALKFLYFHYGSILYRFG